MYKNLWKFKFWVYSPEPCGLKMCASWRLPAVPGAVWLTIFHHTVSLPENPPKSNFFKGASNPVIYGNIFCFEMDLKCITVTLPVLSYHQGHKRRKKKSQEKFKKGSKKIISLWIFPKCLKKYIYLLIIHIHNRRLKTD